MLHLNTRALERARAARNSSREERGSERSETSAGAGTPRVAPSSARALERARASRGRASTGALRAVRQAEQPTATLASALLGAELAAPPAEQPASALPVLHLNTRALERARAARNSSREERGSEKAEARGGSEQNDELARMAQQVRGIKAKIGRTPSPVPCPAAVSPAPSATTPPSEGRLSTGSIPPSEADEVAARALAAVQNKQRRPRLSLLSRPGMPLHEPLAPEGHAAAEPHTEPTAEPPPPTLRGLPGPMRLRGTVHWRALTWRALTWRVSAPVNDWVFPLRSEACASARLVRRRRATCRYPPSRGKGRRSARRRMSRSSRRGPMHSEYR